MKTETFKQKLARLAKQPTTWRGPIVLATAGGATLAPELQETIITLGVTIYGGALVSHDEDKA